MRTSVAVPDRQQNFYTSCRVKDITGIDVTSYGSYTQRHFPGTRFKFETSNLLASKRELFRISFSLLFIVNFDYGQVATAFKEVNHVLKKDGQFLFSFHVGEQTVHFDKANDIDVDIDLYFFQTNVILELLRDTQVPIDAVERFPYPDIGPASKRPYVCTN